MSRHSVFMKCAATDPEVLSAAATVTFEPVLSQVAPIGRARSTGARG